MVSLRDSEFVKRHRPKIFALLWFVIGIALVMMATQVRGIPGRDELREVSGIIDSLHEDSRYVRYGPNVYMLRLQLRGADTEYHIDSGRLNLPASYFRASRALRQGNEVTLWYEAHPDFGNRLWQIDQHGRRLINYRETFDHESSEQMNTWLILLGYLLATFAVAPLLLMWQRRVKAHDGKPQAAAENTAN
jgi:hypothetical protein